ncbi:hypothetical protein ACFYOR_05430 [Streptomyces griseofuscus]|uniref:hypothetical protein n=1 Tax=Streptomyces griseofuscus TaxID=146922 RepID=UPI0036BABC28
MLLRSRRGTDMTAAFPEINAAAHTQLPADTGLAAYGDDHHLGAVLHLLIVGAYINALGALGQFGGRAALRQGEGHRATHRPCCAGPRRWPGRSRPLRLCTVSFLHGVRWFRTVLGLGLCGCDGCRPPRAYGVELRRSHVRRNFRHSSATTMAPARQGIVPVQPIASSRRSHLRCPG